MSRSIPAAAEPLEEASGVAWLPFIEISHPTLTTPIRAVSDVIDYQWGGATWTAYPFGFRRISDDDGMPETQLVIQNIDRRIGAAIRSLSGRVGVSMWLLSSADFDLSADPRAAIGTPTPLYSITDWDLLNIKIDPIAVTARVTMRDYATEPWPGIRATEDKFPGLFA